MCYSDLEHIKPISFLYKLLLLKGAPAFKYIVHHTGQVVLFEIFFQQTVCVPVFIFESALQRACMQTEQLMVSWLVIECPKQEIRLQTEALLQIFKRFIYLGDLNTYGMIFCIQASFEPFVDLT
jgi:hypothetical protein